MTEKSSMDRIAKNASLLTFRMLLATAVGLFTSRIVLQALGVVDYGIFGVVGGIVAILGFLNYTLSGSTSRFLAYEMGLGDRGNIAKVFSTVILLHLILALIILILGETFGVYFLENVLEIPENRMFAARVVLQFSILQAMLSIIQLPCIAYIGAREKLQVYALTEIANVLIRLGIAYLLLIVHTDKLILYTILNCITLTLLQIFYIAYCRHISGLSFKPAFNKEVMQTLLGFNGYFFYTCFAQMVCLQVMNFIINVNFNVVYNAAVSIATTVNGAVIGLATTSFQAFRPQIIKRYSAGEIAGMERMQTSGSTFAIASLLAIIAPCFIEAPVMLRVWLGEIPPHSVDFLRVILLMGFFNNISVQVSTPVQAQGNIRRYSLITGTLLLLSPALGSVAVRSGAPAWSVYMITTVVWILCIAAGLNAIRVNIKGFKVAAYAVNMLKIIVCGAIGVLAIYPVHHSMEPTFLRLVCVTISFLCVFGLLIWYFTFTAENRQLVIVAIKKYL